MMLKNYEGSFVTLICDSGARSTDTYCNLDWLIGSGFSIARHVKRFEPFLDAGKLKA